jgi:ADP-L-glycero-D-manno-heptose 6-epimerase
MITSVLNFDNGGFSVKILVTGGSGFVGRNLISRLIKEGHEVTATSMGGENKLPDGVKIIYYSLEGINWNKVHGQDAVIHLAANTNTLCHDRDEMLRSNVNGPIKLFTEAREGGCNRFIYASSTAVYGNSPAPYSESETPLDPLNVYAESKMSFEFFAMDFAQEEKEKEYDPITVIGLRYCNIYGPGEDHKGHAKSVVGQMLHTMRQGKKFKLFKDGEQKRDWVYVDDVVEANILSLTYEGESDIFNIGTGQAVSFNEAANILQKMFCEDGRLAPEYIDCPFPEKYQSHTCCSIEKAKTQLGFSPQYDLSAGLKAYQITNQS